MKYRVVYSVNCTDSTESYIGVITIILPARVQKHRHVLRAVRYSPTAEYAVQRDLNID